MTTRLVIFADLENVASRVLVPQLLRCLQGRSDVVCVGIVTTDYAGYGEALRHHWIARGKRRLQWALGSGCLERSLRVRPLPIERLAKACGAAALVAPGGDPNHFSLIEQLQQGLNAEVAINFYCKKRFRETLLASFAMTVNYHNGLLPRFRGLRASNWSIYVDELASGFTFHRMDAGMDTGGILLEGRVPMLHLETPADLELRKAEAASRELPRILDALVRRAPGRRQVGMGGEHTLQDFIRVTQVEDPSALSREEWVRRLRAFLRIRTRIAGHWLNITGLAPASKPGALGFRTCDGHWLRVVSTDFWPVWITRAGKD
ncbi:MAG: formyl transferase domain protein [Holophagaceae bacterium]|nr:formyl transferase domain protein [Holophagaceae bacterium]